MSREGRILLYVVAVALVAVLALGWLAQRYARIAEERRPPAAAPSGRTR
jgi:hypothetical protein